MEPINDWGSFSPVRTAQAKIPGDELQLNFLENKKNQN